jgi:phage terminase large subunit
MDVGGRWNKGIGGPLALENPQLGRKPELAPEQSLMDGINAGRKTIHFARFDKTRTAQGLESLRSYRTEWARKARAFKKTPDHNWASHGADGWRCLSLSWRAPMREPEPEKVPIQDHMRVMLKRNSDEVWPAS